MRFEEAYEGWHAGELTQMEAARLLAMCDRSFRRYLARYEEFDLQGLIDKRIEQVSHWRASRMVSGRRGSLAGGWFVNAYNALWQREMSRGVNPERFAQERGRRGPGRPLVSRETNRS